MTAVQAGADALGFMLYQGSSRFVTQDQAAQIIRALPPFVSKVGVFVNASQEEVRRAVEKCGLDTLQFHGEEPPEFCLEFQPMKIIKAFRIKDASSLDQFGAFETDAWLLDTYIPGQQGGTGTTFNWELARDAGKSGRPVILAGGLTVKNIGEAVRLVRPYGVDVSSGVESKPGKKDAQKVLQFIGEARRALA